jgi:hypothetical protein
VSGVVQIVLWSPNQKTDWTVCNAVEVARLLPGRARRVVFHEGLAERLDAAALGDVNTVSVAQRSQAAVSAWT